MKYQFSIFILLISSSCTEVNQESVNSEISSLVDTSQYTEPEMIPADSAIYFYPNAKLSQNSEIFIEHGENIVFSYQYSPEVWADCMDCGSTTILNFEVNINENKSFKTTDLKSTKFSYERYCFCDMPDSTEMYMNEGTLNLEFTEDSIWQAEIVFRNIIDAEFMDSENYSDTIRTNFYPYKSYCENEDGTNCYDYLGRKTGKWKIVNSTEIKQGVYNKNLFTGTRLLHATGNPDDTTRLLIFENGNIVSEVDNRKKKTKT